MKLTGTISKLGPAKVLVAGDLMLDKYTIGSARRISPEAPVPVVRVEAESSLPGGAGNVVLNILSLGGEVSILARVGADEAGKSILSMLNAEGCDTSSIFEEKKYSTPVKHRIIANQQQIVRIDNEVLEPISEELEDSIIEAFPKVFEGVKALAISDYGKGFLTVSLLTALIEYAKRLAIPIITDPKGIDFTRYLGTTIIKPNLSEAYAAANMERGTSIELVAKKILEITQAETLMVTRSEKGISLFHRDGTHEEFPVQVKEVKDVTGAGDTVLSVLAVAVANGLHITESTHLSNIAAGIAIEKVGCARVSLSELTRRLLSFDLANKIFDEEHLYALQAAILDRDYVVVDISAEKGLTTELYRALLSLSNENNRDLVVYIREDDPCMEFVSILASLKEVNYIVLKKDSLQHLCMQIQPKESFLLDNGLLHAK